LNQPFDEAGLEAAEISRLHRYAQIDDQKSGCRSLGQTDCHLPREGDGQILGLSLQARACCLLRGLRASVPKSSMCRISQFDTLRLTHPDRGTCCRNEDNDHISPVSIMSGKNRHPAHNLWLKAEKSEACRPESKTLSGKVSEQKSIYNP